MVLYPGGRLPRRRRCASGAVEYRVLYPGGRLPRRRRCASGAVEYRVLYPGGRLPRRRRCASGAVEYRVCSILVAVLPRRRRCASGAVEYRVLYPGGRLPIIDPVRCRYCKGSMDVVAPHCATVSLHCHPHIWQRATVRHLHIRPRNQKTGTAAVGRQRQVQCIINDTRRDIGRGLCAGSAPSSRKPVGSRMEIAGCRSATLRTVSLHCHPHIWQRGYRASSPYPPSKSKDRYRGSRRQRKCSVLSMIRGATSAGVVCRLCASSRKPVGSRMEIARFPGLARRTVVGDTFHGNARRPRCCSGSRPGCPLARHSVRRPRSTRGRASGRRGRRDVVVASDVGEVVVGQGRIDIKTQRVEEAAVQAAQPRRPRHQ